jgi:hypothetical protein
MLQTPIFWLMFVMMTMMSTAGLMVTSQIAAFTRDFGMANALVFGMPLLPLALSVDRITSIHRARRRFGAGGPSRGAHARRVQIMVAGLHDHHRDEFCDGAAGRSSSEANAPALVDESSRSGQNI